MSNVYTEQHNPVLQSLVTLFTLDATEIGGSTFYFTPMTDKQSSSPRDYQKVVWKTHTYQPIPIQMTGSRLIGSGGLAKPTVTISNVDGTIFAAVLTLGDLVGAEVTIERTFEQFLDNGATPNTNAVFPSERYLIEQKQIHNKNIITWSLTSVLDKNQTMIPNRQVLRDDFPGIGSIRLRG